ncbi:MAG: SixA phosphatase family protein, partial [Paracoccaceae bacterium]
MSLKLILMRHAKSGWDDPVEDHDRPLNSRGRISAEVMGKWLQAKGHLPQEALVSTARRTTETFRGLGIAPQKVKFLSSLYHPSAQGLFAALRSATEQTVLMVSHNPGIAEFAELLAKQPP